MAVGDISPKHPYKRKFTSYLNGIVPASGGGTSNFLRADGTWDVPGTPSNSYQVGTLSGNVALVSANTWYSGPSVTIGAGTWLIVGTYVVSYDSAPTIAADIYNGSSSICQNSNTPPSANGDSTATISTVVTVSSSTTLTLRIQANVGSSNITMLQYGPLDTSAPATSISAVNIGSVGNTTSAAQGNSYQISNLSSDVSLTSAATWYSGPSVTIGPGTWLINGNATVSSTSANVYCTADLYNGSSSLASGNAACNSEGTDNIATVSVSTVLTVAVTTTITLRAQNAVSNTTLKALDPLDTSAPATSISAVNIGAIGTVSSASQGNAYQISNLASNVTLTSANTWYNGPSITLGAGTWLLYGQSYFSIASGGYTYTDIYNGASSIVQSAGDFGSTTVDASTTIGTIVTITTNTTFTLRAQSVATGDSLLAYGNIDTSVPGTFISAVNIGNVGSSSYVAPGGYYQSGTLSSNVSLTSANTWYSGPSVTVGAGTWLLLGTGGFSYSAEPLLSVDIYNGASSICQNSAYFPNGTEAGTVTTSTVVNTVTPTTFTLRGQTSATTATMIQYGTIDTSATATSIVAVQIAATGNSGGFTTGSGVLASDIPLTSSNTNYTIFTLSNLAAGSYFLWYNLSIDCANIATIQVEALNASSVVLGTSSNLVQTSQSAMQSVNGSVAFTLSSAQNVTIIANSTATGNTVKASSVGFGTPGNASSYQYINLAMTPNGGITQGTANEIAYYSAAGTVLSGTLNVDQLDCLGGGLGNYNAPPTTGTIGPGIYQTNTNWTTTGALTVVSPCFIYVNGTATITASDAVTVSSSGYLAGGLGADTDAAGDIAQPGTGVGGGQGGKANTNVGGGGGGFAGAGGAGGGALTAAGAGGNTYSFLTQAAGSGGGGAGTAVATGGTNGGAGGGCFYLEASVAINVNANITCTGVAGTSSTTTSVPCGGGGSGGFVGLHSPATTIASGVTVSVAGGAGGSNTATTKGCGGGGGGGGWVDAPGVTNNGTITVSGGGAGTGSTNGTAGSSGTANTSAGYYGPLMP